MAARTAVQIRQCVVPKSRAAIQREYRQRQSRGALMVKSFTASPVVIDALVMQAMANGVSRETAEAELRNEMRLRILLTDFVEQLAATYIDEWRERYAKK